MTTALVPVNDMQTMAKAVAESNLFGIKTPQQAMALMLIAQAEGTHPALAARDYHIIQGRPAIKADAMLARFHAAGGVVEWMDYTDAKVSARFSHPQSSPKPVLIEWTFEQARKIGLVGKDNWKNYPRAMLRARVISEGVRTCYPGIAVGTYTVEEVQDMPRGNAHATVMIEPPPDELVDQHLAAIAAATDRDALTVAWKAAAKAAQNDPEAHKRLKDAAIARSQELEANK
jgi:hypothetical protein